jgi:tetratricopeptide (TPR) repeat protein
MNHRPSASASTRPLALALGLLAWASAPACSARSRMPRAQPVTVEMRAQAEQATQIAKWDQAAQLWYSIFVGSGHRDVQACEQTARAMLHLSDPENALKVLDQGLELEPKSAALHELKGDALVQQNFHRAAVGCYEEATRLAPGRASAWRALGRTRVDLGYEGAAVEPLKQATELEQDDFESWALLARAYEASGDPCSAFLSYVRAFQLGEGDPKQLVKASTLYLNDVVRHAHKESSAACRAWLERAIQRDPQLTQAHFGLGVLEEEQGHRDEAIEHYRRAVEIDPAFLPALRNLALLYSQKRDEAHVREMVGRALKLEKDPDRIKALTRLLEPFSSGGTQPKSPQSP